jgi:hypothetical protein
LKFGIITESATALSAVAARWVLLVTSFGESYQLVSHVANAIVAL